MSWLSRNSTKPLSSGAGRDDEEWNTKDDDEIPLEDSGTSPDAHLTVVEVDSITVDSELPGTAYDANIPLNATGGTGAYTSKQGKVTVDTTPNGVEVTLDLGSTAYANFGGNATTTITDSQTKYLTGDAKGTYSITPKINGVACGDAATGEVFEFEIEVSPDPVTWNYDGAGDEGYYWNHGIKDHTGYTGVGGTGWCGSNEHVDAYRNHTTASKVTYKLFAKNGDTVCYAGEAAASITFKLEWHYSMDRYGSKSTSGTRTTSAGISLGPIAATWSISDNFSTSGCAMEMGGRMRLRAPQEQVGVITYDWQVDQLKAMSSDQSSPGWVVPAQEYDDYSKTHIESNCVFNTVGTSTGEICCGIALLGRTGDTKYYGFYATFSEHDLTFTLNSVTPQ